MAAQTYPKLRSDLVASSSIVDGSIVYTVKDPITGKYFRLRELEYWLVGQLDGATAPETVAERVREKFSVNITPEHVGQFVAMLEGLLFLENSRSEQGISKLSVRAGQKSSLASRLLFVKLKAFKPGPFLDRLTALYRPFHNPFWFVISWLVIITGFSLLFANYSEFNLNLAELFHLHSIGLIIVVLFVMLTLHEYAHAILCRYYGGAVHEMGFLLMYFQPCFYCDISDAWLFPQKSRRLAVTWAGPFYQFLILAVAMIIWRVTVEDTAVNIVARMFVLVCWITTFVNFNPLIKLDGYYMLSDWVEIPNLRQKAFAYLGNVLKRHILGWPIELIIPSRRERKIFFLYGGLAILFSTFLLGYMLYLIGGFIYGRWGGFGLTLFIVALLIILKDSLRNLFLGTVRHVIYMKKLLSQPFRLATYAIVLIAVVVVVLAISFPHRVSGNITVEPLNEFSLSLNAFGLLEQNLRLGGERPESKSSYLQMTSSDMAALELLPLVSDGEQIQSGDTVAILISNQITGELAGAHSELERLQSNLVLLKAPPKKERISEMESQVSAAQSNFNQLKRNLDRIQELVNRKLESTDKLESSQSAFDIAKAELSNKESALRLLKSPPRPEEETVLAHEISKQQARLGFLKVHADAQVVVSPISGTVFVGHGAGKDKSILSVCQQNEIELHIPVSDFDLPLISLGQTVQVKVRSYPDRLFEGRVVRIPAAADSIAGKNYFPVSVLVENSESLLRDGMSGYAKIEIGKKSLVALAYRKLLSGIRVEFWSWW